MTLHLLWTDQCFLAILLLSFFGITRSLRKEHVRRAVGRIFSQWVAVSAAILLLFFLLIAILDSIHFINKNQRLESLLDKVLAPLGSQYEQTYSAPLALTLYSSETVTADGQAMQIHPRLQYPPEHFKSEKEVQGWIKKIILLSAIISFFITGIIWVLIRILRKLKRTTPTAAGISAFLTFFFCCFVSLATFWLSRELHLFGTGKIGQDIFYYTLKSIRTGIMIGVLTTLFMMPLALMLGISAGYFGGFVDDVIQYIYTTLSSIPGVLLITASVLAMQTYIANHPQQFTTLAQSADARLLALCLILGVTSWTSLCRLLRAEALKLREIDYVQAARALGSSPFIIIIKHLLPNVMHIVVITIVLDFSFLVLAEAVLSYVGVGVSPLTISWGNMINAARLELAREPIVWWPMLAAFTFMFVLVLASNLFADAIRDAFDPRQAEI